VRCAVGSAGSQLQGEQVENLFYGRTLGGVVRWGTRDDTWGFDKLEVRRHVVESAFGGCYVNSRQASFCTEAGVRRAVGSGGSHLGGEQVENLFYGRTRGASCGGERGMTLGCSTNWKFVATLRLSACLRASLGPARTGFASA